MDRDFVISKEIEFDMAHRVPNHASKCRNLHGHRYKVVAHVKGNLVDRSGASDEGMVMDFGDLKKVLMEEIHDRYDHGAMFYIDDDIFGGVTNFSSRFQEHMVTKGQNVHWVGFIPTAENLAAYFFQLVEGGLVAKGFPGVLMGLDVWETPTSVARVQR